MCCFRRQAIATISFSPCSFCLVTNYLFYYLLPEKRFSKVLYNINENMFEMSGFCSVRKSGLQSSTGPLKSCALLPLFLYPGNHLERFWAHEIDAWKLALIARHSARSLIVEWSESTVCISRRRRECCDRRYSIHNAQRTFDTYVTNKPPYLFCYKKLWKDLKETLDFNNVLEG